MKDPADNNAAFVAALRRGDVAAAADSYADDAVLMPPSAGVVRGRDAIAAYWRAGVDAGMREVTLAASGKSQNDGLAYEMGMYVIRVEPSDGARAVERGHYVQVYQRHTDGSWRRAVEIFSPGGSE